MTQRRTMTWLEGGVTPAAAVSGRPQAEIRFSPMPRAYRFRRETRPLK
jgi:hypothetical protein